MPGSNYVVNGDVVFPTGTQKAHIVISDGLISDLVFGDYPVGFNGESVLDASGMYVCPGFIDIHTHGALGHNFMDSRNEANDKIATFHNKHGTTSLLGTLECGDLNAMHHAVEVLKERSQPSIIGIHAEGPFLNPARKGAQNADHIIEPSVAALNELVDNDYEELKLMTIAPEMPGADDVIDILRSHQVVVGLGHSDATYDEAMVSLKRGVSHFIHTFNAMRGFHHRDPGAVGAALTTDYCTAELIADGIHVHPKAMRVLRTCKGPHGVCLITDSISAVGLEDGVYTSLVDQDVVVDKGVCRLRDGTLAGSTLTMERAIRNYSDMSGAPLYEAVAAATLVPARILGMDDRKGSIAIGKDADITLLDGSWNVRLTMLGGSVVYKS